MKVGEDDALSLPAQVDLSSLFARPVASAAELSLTAAARRDQVPRHLPWSVEPLDPSADLGDLKASDLRATAWGDAALGAQSQLRRKHHHRQQHRHQQRHEEREGEDGEDDTRPPPEVQGSYNVWSHPDDAPPAFTLYPMEIRTFELRFAD